MATGDANLFPELSIPASTRRTWMSRGVADVVTFQGPDADVVALRAKIGKLDRRVEILGRNGCAQLRGPECQSSIWARQDRRCGVVR